MSKTVKQIQDTLRKLADRETALHSQRFFKTGKGEYGEGDIFLGIRVPILRQNVKKFKGISVRDACTLLRSKFHEERLFALFLLTDLFKNGETKTKRKVYKLYLDHTDHINNWDLVDASAEGIVGSFLRLRKRNPLYQLATSRSLWERRISIISTFHFIKHNDFKDTLHISKILLYDKEDLIHKAVGWMLREIGKRDFETEEKFLKKHYKNMPRTMLRYAIEKFPEEIRQGFLKGRV